MSAVKNRQRAPILKKLFLAGIILTCSVFGILLLIAVFKSGYGYQFDIDELHHANLVYLYLHGYQPYRDIYNTFYTPLFEWVLAPAFLLFGFTFKTITFTRFIMIVLLIIRMGAMYVFAKTLWSRRVALFFLPLFLLDPFLVYSGMQIRTDNFMMTVFSIGLAFLAVGYVNKSIKYKNTAAFFLGLSLVVFMKVIPALLVIGAVVAVEEIRHKQYKTLAGMAFWALVPIFLFMLYGVIIGGASEMWQQLIVESQASYSNFRYPVAFGNYNRPDNIWVYGAMGEPLTWIYAWMFPLLGAAGWYQVIHSVASKNEKSTTATVKIMMWLLLIVELIVMFRVPSVFLQHYLQLNWLFALFGAIAIDDLITAVSPFPIAWYSLVIILCLVFIPLTNTAIELDTSRGTIGMPETEATYEKYWAQIPENEPTFPSFLFRPQIYPVPFGDYVPNLPDSILNRLPSIPATLEKTKLKHLIIDDYTLNQLPRDAQTYIMSHYTLVSGDNQLRTRNQ